MNTHEQGTKGTRTTLEKNESKPEAGIRNKATHTVKPNGSISPGFSSSARLLPIFAGTFFLGAGVSSSAASFAALAFVVGFLAWEGGFFAVVLALEGIDSVDKMLLIVETALKWRSIGKCS
jgi:hypothetical protein